ncbi:unnamed protein product [Symbiodinium microadriaticum]|nr:unnamed protein product [Symbiodinium microadriaticum]
MRDPPSLLRGLFSRVINRSLDPARRATARAKAEAARQKAGAPHEVHYFHQIDDPYSHLIAQTLKTFVARYDIKLTPHIIRATGGVHQPRFEDLAIWARRDAGLIAPHYGVSFPDDAPTVPDETLIALAAQRLAGLSPDDFLQQIEAISTAVWTGDQPALENGNRASPEEAEAALDEGSALLKDLNHYSGGMLYYGGEWYWGIDRLLHLEQRLRDLGACTAPDEDFIAPRPSLDVSGIDASDLELHFFPSLNSPYTSIIFDKTVELARACNINLIHKPVLPMVMRGVPAPRSKAAYIMSDTRREGELLDVEFGPLVMPIGEPTRQVYSLFEWAKTQGPDKDVDLLGSALRHAFRMGVPLHKTKGMKQCVEAAGLNWEEAKKVIGNDGWKAPTLKNQDEMIDGMGLWGVPSYKLSGRDGEPDLEVWGQDRLWLIAAEIRRRAGKT